MEKSLRRNVFFISLSQFGAAFCGNFVKVILPFFILKVSPYPERETLIWIGFVIGITHLLTAIFSNVWGALTSRFSPKLLYMRGMFAQMIVFSLMGFTSNLFVILLLRILQGIMGGISTIGLIIISASSSRERISADIGFFQTLLTLGLLIAPPAGSLAASLLGYNGAFLAASGFLLITALFCQFYVTDVKVPSRKERLFDRSAFNRCTIFAWLICFSVTVQLMFLPSILPSLLDQFRVEREEALKLAGIIVTLYTGTATLGMYVWSRIAHRFGRDRLLLMLMLSGTLCQCLLSFATGLFDFIVIRMLQTGLIAACVPLVISIFATELKGTTIGFLNSGRFGGSALGPMIATWILAFSNFTAVYLSIAGMTILAFLGFRAFGGKRGRSGR